MTSPYIARRATVSVPVWNLYAHGQEVGVATIYETDCEGPMASVTYDPIDPLFVATFQAPTLAELLKDVGLYLRMIDAKLNADADYEQEIQNYSDGITQ